MRPTESSSLAREFESMIFSCLARIFLPVLSKIPSSFKTKGVAENNSVISFDIDLLKLNLVYCTYEYSTYDRSKLGINTESESIVHS